MRFNGIWLLCPDGATRPALAAELLAGDGSWVNALFLLDTDHDRAEKIALVQFPKQASY